MSIRWTPDTGAETSAVSLNYAKKMGFKKEDLAPPRSRLLNADNREMQCFGTCHVTLQLGSIKHTVEAAVVRQLNGPLLSWHDCIRLHILPESYPQQILYVRAIPAAATPAEEEGRAEEVATPGTPKSRRIQPPKWTPRTV